MSNKAIQGQLFPVSALIEANYPLAAATHFLYRFRHQSLDNFRLFLFPHSFPFFHLSLSIKIGLSSLLCPTCLPSSSLISLLPHSCLQKQISQSRKQEVFSLCLTSLLTKMLSLSPPLILDVREN